MRKATLEIGVDGKIDRAAKLSEMHADLIKRDAIVGLADRPRKACAGRCNCLEPEMREGPRAADIPGIWQHEAAGLVHLTECRAFVRCGDRHISSRLDLGGATISTLCVPR